MRFLLLGIIATLCLSLSTRRTLAELGENWNGPGCQLGAASFVVCSQEPSDPDDPGQCYVSHYADYFPNRIELDLIGICQAAKAALMAPASDRSDALIKVVGRGEQLNAEISSDPADAQGSAGAIESVGHDLQALGGSVTVYSSSESEGDWGDVSDALSNLTTDAQVWGGGL